MPSLCRLPSFPGARSPVAFCRGRSQRARIHNFKYSPQSDRQKVKDNCRLSNDGGARPTQPLSPAATQPFVVPPQHNSTQHGPRRPFTTIISTLTIQLASLPNSHFEAALGIFFFSFSSFHGAWLWNVHFEKKLRTITLKAPSRGMAHICRFVASRSDGTLRDNSGFAPAAMHP